MGPRAALDKTKACEQYDRRLRDLGEVRFDRIEIAPFVVERFGMRFRLIVREPEDDGEPWAVQVQPGNYMAFFEPWDSGEYDT